MNKTYGLICIFLAIIFLLYICNLHQNESYKEAEYIKENSTEFLRLQNFEIVSYCGFSQGNVSYIVKSTAVKNNILYKVTLYKNKDEINMNLSEILKATN